MEEQGLAGLRDIHLPPVPDGLSIWPLVAAVTALLLGLVAFWLVWRRSRRNWANEVAIRLADETSSPTLLDAAQLLRRAALLKLGPTAGKLQGDDWLAALDRLFATTLFTGGEGRIFGSGLYAAKAGPLPPDLREALRRAAARRGRWPW